MERIFIAGVDEAGRGPLVGPVTAACVVLEPSYRNSKIQDSKKLSEKLRNGLFLEIKEAALAYSIISVGPKRIDSLNILEATKVAMGLAVNKVQQKLERQFGKAKIHCLIDGNMKFQIKHSYESIVKGDSKIFSIAAASILAKVERDHLMRSLEEKYPGYGIEKHKGYPTKLHKEQVALLGPSPVHRLTFSGVREYA